MTGCSTPAGSGCASDVASSIGPSRKALWYLLGDAEALSGVQKTYKRADYPEGAGIALLGITDPDEVDVLLGPDSAGQETYGIELLLWWYDAEASEEQAADVDEACFDMADAVRDLVRANSTLRLPGASQGTVVRARAVIRASDGVRRPTTDDSVKQATGLLCLIQMTVVCVARAT